MIMKKVKLAQRKIIVNHFNNNVVRAALKISKSTLIQPKRVYRRAVLTTALSASLRHRHPLFRQHYSKNSETISCKCLISQKKLRHSTRKKLFHSISSLLAFSWIETDSHTMSSHTQFSRISWNFPRSISAEQIRKVSDQLSTYITC